MSQQEVTFQDFADQFPEIEFPVLLNDEAHLIFSRNNDPISEYVWQKYIHPLEDSITEYTEFVPCFAINSLTGIVALVYWKADLMDYQYVLATFDQTGNFLDRRAIAGMYTDGKVITRSVANIGEDLAIHVISGQVSASDQTSDYDAASSVAFELQIDVDGMIVNEV